MEPNEAELGFVNIMFKAFDIQKQFHWLIQFLHIELAKYFDNIKRYNSGIDLFMYFMHTNSTKVVPHNLKACPT